MTHDLIRWLSRWSVLSLLAAACVTPPAHAETILVDTTTLNFGIIAPGRTVSLHLGMENPSDKQLNVEIRTSCDCVTVSPSRFAVKPGGLREVLVAVDTKDLRGSYEEHLFIQSNDPARPYIPVTVTGRVSAKKKALVNLIVFDSKGCLYCARLKKEVFPALEKKYSLTLAIQEYDVSVPGNYEKLMAMEKEYAVPMTKLPALFINGQVIGGKEEIRERLEDAIRRAAGMRDGEANATASFPRKRGSRNADSQSAPFGILPVIAAGLIDGINPCAFATIIFLISYLSFILKRSRGEIAAAGILFIAGVYITYFLTGMGLLKGLQKLEGVFAASRMMYGILAGVVAIAGAVNLFDAVTVIRKGRQGYARTRATLPDLLREKIHSVIRSAASARYLYPFIFIAAIAITFLELACTGQVYLPAIMYMTTLPGSQARGIAWLAFYCFLFILPLAVVFILFHYGLSTGSLKRFFDRHFIAAKLAMAIFFFAMAATLLLTAHK